MARRPIRVEVENLENVLHSFRKADEAVQREILDLIQEAADMVYREIYKKAPVGKKSKGSRKTLRTEVGKDAKGFYYARVTIGGREHFYIVFYELGTSRQPPRPFMRTTFEENKNKIRQRMADGLRDIIERQGR